MKKMVLPQPSKDYSSEEERIRNREIESSYKSLVEKVAELESRIKALEP
jgi:hypothetical protein